MIGPLMESLVSNPPSDLQVVIQAFLASPQAAVLAFVFGALWGSFFNVCIARIPLGKSVVRPRSFCFSCKAPIPGWQNIPIVSYLILRGRCGKCGARFSPRYMLVEALMGVISLLLFWTFVRAADADLPVLLARYAVFFAFCGVLLVLGFIDLDTKRLPDIITLPSIVIFFLAGFGLQMVPWQERAIGAVAGYVAVRLISDAYYYLRGREGLGLGDGKLLAVMGALLGWKALPPIVFASSFLGILIAVPAVLLVRARGGGQAPPGSEGDAETDTREPEMQGQGQGELEGDVEGEGEREGEEPVADEASGDPALRFTQIPFGPFLALSALAYVFTADTLWPRILLFLSGEP